MKYEFLTVQEVANVLKVTKMTIYRYIKAKKITAYKVGKDFRINKEEFDKFIENIKHNKQKADLPKYYGAFNGVKFQ